MTATATFVLLHGAWHGAWCWRRVAERLRAGGHHVHAVTCTGLGERAHLLSPTLTLDTFIADVVGLIEAEELHDVVLVAHSFGGIVAIGAADRIADRLRHVIFLDAALIEPGQTPFDFVPAPIVEERRRLAQASPGGLSIPPPDPSVFGIPDGPDAEWVRGRLTPHPLSVYESPLNIRNGWPANLPRTYIDCTTPPHPSFENLKSALRRTPGWNWREIATGHNAMITAPDALTALLVDIATSDVRAALNRPAAERP